jgi:hypothetical protein
VVADFQFKQTRMKAFKIVGIVCFGTLAGISLLWWGCKPHQPSDASLERRFDRERPEFERLVRMMEEDWNMSRIAPDFTWRQDNVAWPRPESEWGISNERWNDYKRLFSQTGLDDGITRPEKSSDTLLDVWSWGLVVGGRSVSYVHCGPPRDGSAHTVPPCLQDKDSGRVEESPGDAYRFKKIAPDWYIFEESN